MNELTIVVLPTGPLDTNCLVIHDGSRATVIDPGMGAAPLVRATVQELGLTVEQIVLTHGHIDHVRDLPELQQE
ncbi:MBL fold metallo-hydrolase, partial [Corynebacterium variabile]